MTATSFIQTKRLYHLLALFSATAHAWLQQGPSYIHNAKQSLTTCQALETLVEPLQTLQSTLDQPLAVTADTWSSLVTAATIQAGGLEIHANTLLPAHGHNLVQGWFGSGPPDIFLQAGHSIAPSTKSLTQNLGITPTATAELPDRLQVVVKQGWKLLDARTLQPQSFLPGFTPPHGILPFHSAPPETPQSLAVTVEWSARYLQVVDKLPSAALAYAMVEFFLLRPNIDLYKEEIAQEPAAVAMETAVTTAVRVAALSIVGFVTLFIFG